MFLPKQQNNLVFGRLLLSKDEKCFTFFWRLSFSVKYNIFSWEIEQYGIQTIIFNEGFKKSILPFCDACLFRHDIIFFSQFFLGQQDIYCYCELIVLFIIIFCDEVFSLVYYRYIRLFLESKEMMVCQLYEQWNRLSTVCINVTIKEVLFIQNSISNLYFSMFRWVQNS
eukprot:TRINITY_DN4454_c0_g3_i2.p3 TRINITY_DN4454_c0_g3~~TRINITY_DN4454_c0_g3_i2.p3  ORF type:complete len:169 (+),score=0.72 TRINITY_DN4454_c0_g3_i2:784-1290(+)